MVLNFVNELSKMAFDPLQIFKNKDKNWVFFQGFFSFLKNIAMPNFCCNCQLVSRFSGFLEPEMQVLPSWLTLRLCLALPSFFPSRWNHFGKTLRKLPTNCLASSSRAAKTQYTWRRARWCFSLEDAWNGRDSLRSTSMTFFSPLLRGITEFIEKANDSIIFLLRGTFFRVGPKPIIVEKQKKRLDVVKYNVAWKSEQLHNKK